MPHLILDYSANLRGKSDFGALCAELCTVLIDLKADGKPVYPMGGIRVRAFPAEDYTIADGRADAAYVHGRLSVAQGRPEAVLKSTGDALLEVMKQHFAAYSVGHGLALSLEIMEVPETRMWKDNNLHARLRGS